MTLLLETVVGSDGYMNQQRLREISNQQFFVAGGLLHKGRYRFAMTPEIIISSPIGVIVILEIR